jgi:hypothetical protein
MKQSVLFLTAVCVSCSSHESLGPVVPKTRIERQMIGLLEKFDRWDDDGDGQLDAAELDQGIASLRGKPQQVDYNSKQVIDFYDANKNRRISMQEAQAAFQRSGEAEKRLTH